MVPGAICGSKYKAGSGFTFVVKPYQPNAFAWHMSTYCGELNAWAGTSASGPAGEFPYYPSVPGGTIMMYDSSSYYTNGLPAGGITPCNFCNLTMQTSGNGSITDNATVYGSYRKQGTSITFTATPASGYKLKKLVVNGSVVTTSGNIYNTTIQDDMNVIAYFVPSSYSATCNSPSGGTVTATKNGIPVSNFPNQPITNLQPDDVIAITATPNSDKMVQNFVVDGYVTSGGSTGPQTFTFTVYERDDDAIYNCTVAFSDRSAVTDSVVGKSDGTTDDATVTCNGTSVTRTNGAFMAFIGNAYLATAHEPTIFRTYNGWINGNGELVSATYAYGWTQGSQSVSITASYNEKPLYTENFLIGTSTSDAGTTSGTAYIAGCRATITRPNGESKIVESETKYLGGSRTVTATTIPNGWSFVGVYVSDTDASGGTKIYKANGASSVTFACACNANIYALFQNGASVDPSDVDQGDSQIATGSSANGLYEWCGSDSKMTMRYHSKRFISSMPIAISTARIYADGYATNGTNDAKLKTLTFQSPNSTDASAIDTVAKSQDAYRTPMRRPEKYIEMVVTAPHQITQVAISTSMEALWQN